jgi:hypothetical protein
MSKLTKLMRAAKKAAEAAKAAAKDADAPKVGPRKTPKDTPAKADAERMGAAERMKNRKAAEAQRATQRSSSINKRTVSAEDIRQANTASQFATMQRRIDDMDSGMRKSAMQKMLDAQRKQFEDMQSAEVDRAGRKAAQSARDRKMKGKVTLPEMPFSKGGMATKKYNKGGYANCGASMKPDGKRRK